jgi:carbamoyl-phosphate synthase large subunit
MKERILITGIGGPAGRSALAYFKGKGYPVVGTDVRELDSGADSFHMVPLARDPAYPGALLEIIRAERVRLYVPTVTEELVTVSRLRGAVEALGARVFISGPFGVEIAEDKLKTARFLSERGLRAPVSFDERAPREEVLGSLGLPLLVKPLKSRGGRGVVVYMTEDEFYKEERAGILFQEFVPGEEFDVNLFVEDDGTVSAAVSLRKTALKEGITGNAAGVERAGRADAVELGKEAAGALELTGPLDIDIRLTEDGAPVVLEINARLGGNVLSAVEVLDSLLNTWKKEERSDALT